LNRQFIGIETKKEEPMSKIIIEIADSLKREFKVKVTSEGKTIKEVLTELIKGYVEGQ